MGRAGTLGMGRGTDRAGAPHSARGPWQGGCQQLSLPWLWPGVLWQPMPPGPDRQVSMESHAVWPGPALSQCHPASRCHTARPGLAPILVPCSMAWSCPILVPHSAVVRAMSTWRGRGCQHGAGGWGSSRLPPPRPRHLHLVVTVAWLLHAVSLWQLLVELSARHPTVRRPPCAAPTTIRPAPAQPASTPRPC